MEIDTKEEKLTLTDLSWQIGSKTPPKVCLCCGFPFDSSKRKMMGPYYDSPYIWLCSDCHSKDYLHCPDKEYSKIHLKEVIVNMRKSVKSIRNENMMNEKITFTDRGGEGLEHLGITNYEGKKIGIPLEYIPLIDLALDSNNVRFRHIGPSLSEMQMEELIWKDHDTLLLYKDIKNTLGIIEPLYVDANNVVIEGNRRLVCLRKLAHDIRSDVIKKIPIKYIDPVPCRVIPNDLHNSDKDEFLARIHIGGKKQWRPLDQASHLHELYNIYGKGLDLLSEITGLTKKTIIDSIKAYEITSEYHKRHPEDGEWVSKFSYFLELIRKPSIEKWIKKKANLRLVMMWIAAGQIPRGDEIRRIPALLQNKTAFENMKKGEKLRNVFTLTERKPKTKDKRESGPTVRVNNNTDHKSMIDSSSRNHQMTLDGFFGAIKEILANNKNTSLSKRDIVKLTSLRSEIDNLIKRTKENVNRN